MPRSNLCRDKAEIQNEKFYRWLKGKMAENDLSQTDLAKVLGIKQQMVSYKIRNFCFSFQEVLKIVHNFDVDEDELKKLMMY